MSDDQDFDFLSNLDHILGNINDPTEDFDLINDLSSDAQPTIALPNVNLFAEELQQLRVENQALHEQIRMLQDTLNKHAGYEVMVNDLSQQKAMLQEKLELAAETIERYRCEVESLTEQLQTAHGVTVDANQKLLEISHLTSRNKELERRVGELQAFEQNVKMVMEVATGTPAELFSLNLLEETLSRSGSSKMAPQDTRDNDALAKQRKEEIAKIKSKCYAYLMYMRKRYEQITGWRFNMKSPVEYQFILSVMGKGNEFRYTVQPGNRLVLSPNPFLSQNMKLLEELKLKTPPDSPETNRKFYPALMAASMLRAIGLI